MSLKIDSYFYAKSVSMQNSLSTNFKDNVVMRRTGSNTNNGLSVNVMDYVNKINESIFVTQSIMARLPRARLVQYQGFERSKSGK